MDDRPSFIDFHWLIHHAQKLGPKTPHSIPPCALVSLLGLSSTECPIIGDILETTGRRGTMAKPPTPESRGLLQVVVYDGLIPVNTGVILGPASKSEEVPSFFSSTSSLNGPACPPTDPLKPYSRWPRLSYLLQPILSYVGSLISVSHPFTLALAAPYPRLPCFYLISII